jgi:protein-disulfide isomerase
LIRILALALMLAVADPAIARPDALKVSETPPGGYVLGNPQAKIRLLEYMSFTCSHCAHFSTEGAAVLKRGFVARGEVSYEVRNAVRDAFDLTAALLARCGGPGRFFGNMDVIFANQAKWMADLQKLDTTKLQKADHATVVRLIAQGSGLNALMAKRGFTPVQLRQCLNDKAATDKIIAMTKDAWDVRKIQGTPSFYINDVSAGPTTTYEQLEPQLKAALVPATAPKTEVKP